MVAILSSPALSAPSRKKSGTGVSFIFGLSTEETQRRAERVDFSRDSLPQRKGVKHDPRALDWKKLHVRFVVIPKQCVDSLEMLSAEVL